jgi:hypothetical protein
VIHSFFKAHIDPLISLTGLWGHAVEHREEKLAMRDFIGSQCVQKLLLHAILIAQHQRELHTWRVDHTHSLGIDVREGLRVDLSEDTVIVEGVKAAIEGSSFADMKTNLSLGDGIIPNTRAFEIKTRCVSGDLLTGCVFEHLILERRVRSKERQTERDRDRQRDRDRGRRSSEPSWRSVGFVGLAIS